MEEWQCHAACGFDLKTFCKRSASPDLEFRVEGHPIFFVALKPSPSIRESFADSLSSGYFLFATYKTSDHIGLASLLHEPLLKHQARVKAVCITPPLYS